jgi:TetR/AcrR family transcriptional regulator, transcriptional repressor of bet genes
MIHTDMPVTDPTPNLAPTARRILDAAIRVLDQHGFAGLTFERIAREAGENGALIRYHFGSKAGLVGALIDTVIYAEAKQLMAILSPLQPGEERRQALFNHQHQVADGRVAFTRFFELVPNMLRDPELRPKLRDFLRWYRALDGWAIAGERPDREQTTGAAPLGLLSVAMLDGLALQALADPDLDVEPAFRLWKQLVVEHLETASRS